MHIFVLGRHLGFGNCGGLGRGKICRGSRREVEKTGVGGGGGKAKNTPARSVCSLAEPVHQIDGVSDWCGRLQIDR